MDMNGSIRIFEQWRASQLARAGKRPCPGASPAASCCGRSGAEPQPDAEGDGGSNATGEPELASLRARRRGDWRDAWEFLWGTAFGMLVMFACLSPGGERSEEHRGPVDGSPVIEEAQDDQQPSDKRSGARNSD